MYLFDLDSPQNGSYAVTLHAKDIGLTIIKTYKESDGLSEAEVTAFVFARFVHESEMGEAVTT